MKISQHIFSAAVGGLVAGLLVLWLADRPAGQPVVQVSDAPGPLLFAEPPVPLAAPRPDLPTAAIDLRPAARRATPAVVHVNAQVEARDRATVKALFGREDTDSPTGGEGSGVIYSANGYIITNYHVVQAADNITVTTSDRRRFTAEVVGMEPKTDLAVLKIDAVDLPFLEFADSDLAEPGQWVLAIGSPLKLTSTVTAGIVSAKGRNLSLLRDPDAIESFIQTDAAVNPGNSGGPLVDTEGRLLGINTAIASRTGRFQGYSFAIPSDLVRRIVDDIIQYGSYRRALMGVEISTLTVDDIERLDLRDRSEGVVVDAIFPGGAAETGGLRVNDLIVAVDGRPIRDLPVLTEIIGRARPGDRLVLTVIRENKSRELTIDLLPADG
ncbi:S1C family serine protease [Lewinella sp. IMCC34183]|uniref:S1C family serine protease n=1 Tax=Lewinella sp. IMCC34183 TaxID=2248762 RepID=UPI000E255B4A|nr:trypsin-like peptidase domain-containing protein [Lewinella sp. IMCC34183]